MRGGRRRPGHCRLKHLLAEKLRVYREAFDKACGPLFEEANDGSNAEPSAAAIKNDIHRALRFIAGDFAHEFNAKLASAVRDDPSVELVAG